MTSIPDAIAAALAAEIRARRGWDEAPALYTLYVRAGRAGLRQIPGRSLNTEALQHRPPS
jgi:hypothetical protein